MRRAERLFQIVEYLKARQKVVRAQELADMLEVSVRTIYRDMAELIANGVPVTGEAGTGYLLDHNHLIKPLMFNTEEIDALVLGARMVHSWGDQALAKSAYKALDKILSTLPRSLHDQIEEEMLFSFPSKDKTPIHVDMSLIRQAIRQKQKIEITYMALDGQNSRRQIRPLSLALFAPHWLLLGWCENKHDFRSFRLDRITNMSPTTSFFKEEAGKRVSDFIKSQTMPR